MTNITCSRISCLYNDEGEKYRGECQRTEVKLIDKQVGNTLLFDCRDYKGVKDGKRID